MLSAFKVHSATVETYSGVTPTGDAYAAPVTVPGFLDEGLVRVQNSSGEQLVQSTRFFCDVADEALFTPQSRVTVNGHVGQVTRTRRREAGAMFALVEHLEVELT